LGPDNFKEIQHPFSVQVPDLGGVNSSTAKKNIWKCGVPLKIRVFLWQVFLLETRKGVRNVCFVKQVRILTT
jgi:hypothetical protein